MLNVDVIIEKILAIQETKKLLKAWHEEANKAKADLTIIPGLWPKIVNATDNLRDFYIELGEALSEATWNWSRDELLAVFSLLEE